MSSKIDREALRNLLYGLVNDPEAEGPKEDVSENNLEINEGSPDNCNSIKEFKNEIRDKLNKNAQRGTAANTFKGTSKAL